MKLSTLLEQSAKYDPVLRRPEETHAPVPVLSRCLGDGFLLAKNRIYAQARRRATQSGFTFSSDQNDAYRALPLSQLESILQTKVIPYLDNVSVLEDLEKRIPKQTVWNDISDNLKGNSVFHESCHAFANRRLMGLEPGLRMLLEESYANACELISIIDAEDPVHRIFLELNSYVFMLNDRVHLVNAANGVGLSALTRYLLLCYLHANFLRESIDFQRVVELAFDVKPDDKMLKNLRQLAKIVFQLNPRFREVTTRFYFKLSGRALELDRDFMSELANSDVAKRFFRELGEG